MTDLENAIRTRSSAFARTCAAGLIFGAIVLTSIGGEGGNGAALPWLAALTGLTLIWLTSLAAKPVSPALVLGTALVIRLVFLFMPTGDDVFRYVWEGRILLEGFNPYVHAPTDPLLAGCRDDVWKSVGHPGVTAIYPPLTQWIFAALASVKLGALGFKIAFSAADMLLCALLCSRFGPRPAIVYAWNPLAAVSIAGGGHYDSLFMLAMVLAWFSWKQEAGSPVRTAVLTGVAIALKWMALPIALWLVVDEWHRRGLKSAALISCCTALPAVLTWAGLCLWTGEWTLQLMPAAFSKVARSAELLPAVADVFRGAGPIDNHWFFGALILAWIWVAFRSRSFLDAAEWSFFATYVLSPMLHAWYFIWILPFAVKSRNWGSIALASTGITYFIVHYRFSQPGGEWTFSWWERAVIWLPFLVGTAIQARAKAKLAR